MRRLWLLLSSVVVVTLVAVACGGGSPSTPTASPVPTATVPPTVTSVPASPTPDPATAIMWRSFFALQDSDWGPVEAMVASGDVRFIPVLLELRMTPIWLPLVSQRLDQSMLDLVGGTGERRVSDWIKWIGSSPEIHGPPGFDQWKGQLLADNIDERMAEFFPGEIKKNIRIEEIVWGGVPRDGIPDLQNPPHIGADEADYLGPDDRVFGVSINGEHRAYPHRILNWHEMANDTLGGEPIALAY